jgi:hypothetical protein
LYRRRGWIVQHVGEKVPDLGQVEAVGAETGEQDGHGRVRGVAEGRGDSDAVAEVVHLGDDLVLDRCQLVARRALP